MPQDARVRHAARPVAEGGKKLAVNLWVLERPFEVYRTSLKTEDGGAVPRRGQLRDHPVAGASVHYLDGRWKAANDASGVTIPASVPGDIITDLQVSDDTQTHA